MPDEQTHETPPFDIDPEIEALLSELEPADLDRVAPPPDVWAGIERRLADEPAPVVELARRRSSLRTPWLLGVAAALLIAVVGVGMLMNRSADETVVATAELAHDADAFDPLGADATATARLVERDGTFEIVLDDASFPSVDEDADLELWLIETDDAGAIVDVAPVALVRGAGSYTVPASLDVSTHRIVDISIEPRDGDEQHSGRSILRGALTEV